jgi:hypothetical protein
MLGLLLVLSVSLSKYCGYVLLSTVREEHKLRVFENRVVRRIFGPKRSDRRVEKTA